LATELTFSNTEVDERLSESKSDSEDSELANNGNENPEAIKKIKGRKYNIFI